MESNYNNTDNETEQSKKHTLLKIILTIVIIIILLSISFASCHSKKSAPAELDQAITKDVAGDTAVDEGETEKTAGDDLEAENEELEKETETEEEHEHVLTREVLTAPTCITSGEAKYTCETCGYSYAETLAATGHKAGLWTTVTEATGSKEGWRELSCAVCVKNAGWRTDSGYRKQFGFFWQFKFGFW